KDNGIPVCRGHGYQVFIYRIRGMSRNRLGKTAAQTIQTMIMVGYIISYKFAAVHRRLILPADSLPETDNIGGGVRKLPAFRQKTFHEPAGMETDFIAVNCRVCCPVI